MNAATARNIMDNYREVPRIREDQEALIARVYPGRKLRGIPFSGCSDRQIYAVANEVYQRAREFEPPQTRLRDNQGLIRRAEIHYHNMLRTIFNVREDIDPAQLEAQLLYD